ncbi:MAG: TIGR04282 family arsenosugar biosynthesis glycosyltransferase [Bacteroidetes bacterium]|nr:TIGR04282 family arsenosugar biosynthesis glycosyltransferase [Bacteroidota bacterium]
MTDTQSMRNAAASPRFPAVILYVRAPRPGRVKTRLAHDIGLRQAAAVYDVLLGHALDCIRPLHAQARLILECADSEDVPLLQLRVAGLAEVRAQSGAGLGERMADSFDRVFSEGADAAILVGSDLPGLHHALLLQGIGALRYSDIVLGPARDGGYYLIGMRRHNPELFAGVTWSDAATCLQTVRNIDAQQLSLETLPMLSDIDTAADLYTWVHAHPEHPITNAITAVTDSIAQH